jgi:hypothetical protein
MGAEKVWTALLNVNESPKLFISSDFIVCLMAITLEKSTIMQLNTSLSYS